jgi:hypothetical protein
MRRKKLIIIAGALIIAIAVTVATIAPRRESVRYHVNRLHYLRQPLYKDAPSELDGNGRLVHLADYLHFRTWRWYWRGGLNIARLIEEQEKHQQALIRLGYYDRREFVLTNRTIDAQLFAMAMVTNGVDGESVWLQMDDSKEKWFRVTARKVDMSLVERSVIDFDTSKEQ